VVALDGREVRGDHPEAGETWLCWRADEDVTVEPAVSSRRERVCRDCRQEGDYAYFDQQGRVHGWLCVRCDYKRELKRMGWRRRVTRRVRILLTG